MVAGSNIRTAADKWPSATLRKTRAASAASSNGRGGAVAAGAVAKSSSIRPSISPSNHARARRRTCCATPSPRGLRRADRTHIGRINSSTQAASEPESATALRADRNAAAQGIHADLGTLRYEW
eukprot:jgi/Botrbrau1/7414/Bobra.0112s0014.1